MDTSGEERCRVPMPRIRITHMHGSTVEELAKLAAKAESPYTRRVLQAVVMTANGIPAEVIAKTLGCCHATVCKCIHVWNEHGLEGAKDHRGGNVGRLTDEMLGDIDDAIRHRSPKDQGYQQNRWTCKLLARYIRDTYGVGYSDEWVRRTLHRLGHTYKRGARKPPKADKEAQMAFKKNTRPAGRAYWQGQCMPLCS